MLKNRLGITDAQTLSSAESDISSQRLAEIRVGTAPEATRGNFDLDHFKAIHQHTFGDVYEGAGVTRAEPVTIEGETHTQPPLLMKETTVFTPAPQVDEKLTHGLVKYNGIRLLHKLADYLSFIVLHNEHLHAIVNAKIYNKQG